jgi:cation transport regulator
MPYATDDELPAGVRNALPPHARDIYREAFNHAWAEYGADESRVHRVAWGAVKRLYEKRDGTWQLRDR